MVIFCDLDGTLIRTESANAKAYVDALSEFGFEISSDEFCNRYNGLSRKVFLPEITETSDPNLLDRIWQSKKSLFRNYIDQTVLITPVHRLLESFVSSGDKVYLVTTASREAVDELLSFHQIQHLFDGIVCGDDVNQHKPAPECYERAMEMSRSNPSQCLVLEDSDAGVQAAKTANLTVLRLL